MTIVCNDIETIKSDFLKKTKILSMQNFYVHYTKIKKIIPEIPDNAFLNCTEKAEVI